MSQAAGLPMSLTGFFEFPFVLDKNPELAKKLTKRMQYYDR